MMQEAVPIPVVNTAIGLYLGLGVAALAALQVLLLAALNNWSARRAVALAAKIKSDEKQEDWRRQDAVAAKVTEAAEQTAKAAKLLVDAQETTIAGTQEVARLAAENAHAVTEQLTTVIDGNKKIHTLVNSDMTAARTAERDSTSREVLTLQRLHAMSEKLGLPVTDEEKDVLAKLEARVDELNQILADRLAAQAKVDADAK